MQWPDKDVPSEESFLKFWKAFDVIARERGCGSCGGAGPVLVHCRYSA